MSHLNTAENKSKTVELSIAEIQNRVNFVANALANVNARDQQGKSALHWTVENNDEFLIISLRKRGADIRCATYDENETPLHTAVKNGNSRAIELLLRNYDIFARDVDLDDKTNTTGSTELHIAVQMGRFDLVKTLLKYRVPYLVHDKAGRTPVDLATDENIVELFRIIAELTGLMKMMDRTLVSKLRSLNRDVLLAVGSACDNNGMTLHDRLMFAHRKTNFCGEAYSIIWFAQQQDKDEFESTLYIKRSSRNRG